MEVFLRPYAPYRNDAGYNIVTFLTFLKRLNMSSFIVNKVNTNMCFSFNSTRFIIRLIYLFIMSYLPLFKLIPRVQQ